MSRIHYWFRTVFVVGLVTPILRATGYRFDSSWRHGETRFKEFVYGNLLCTFAANIKADDPVGYKRFKSA